jgi:hypothetical protein
LDSAQALLLAQGKLQHVDTTIEAGTLAVFDLTGLGLGLANLATDGTLRAQRLFTWAADLAQSSDETPTHSSLESQ